MERAGIRKFAGADFLCCPRCGAALQAEGASLRCPAGHCYDLSARGYANLLPGHGGLKGYDQGFFQARRRILEAGYYRPLQDAVASRLRGRVADLGCGEGSYARAAAQAGFETVGLDAAPEAIREAAKGGGPVLWLVADLAHPPLREGSVDTLLNLFTPANYEAFRRILAPGGQLLKAVPGPLHLQELRHALGDRLRSGEAYDSERVAAHFRRHFAPKEEVRLTQTLPIDADLLRAFLRMTPLAFSLSESDLADIRVDRITTDALLLTGCQP